MGQLKREAEIAGQHTRTAKQTAQTLYDWRSQIDSFRNHQTRQGLRQLERLECALEALRHHGDDEHRHYIERLLNNELAEYRLILSRHDMAIEVLKSLPEFLDDNFGHLLHALEEEEEE